jgi:polysaccharide pyruvyl transferase WcaK-like protein
MRGKIGVWGHFHGGNIGDDIVVATLIANIRRRLPGHEIYGFSLSPGDTARRHGVPSGTLDGGPIHPVGPESNGEFPRSASNGGADPAAESGGEPGSGRQAIKNLLKKVPGAVRVRRILGEAATSLTIWRRMRGFDAVFVAGSGPVFDDMGGAWVHPYNLLRWAILCRLAGVKFCLMNVGAGPIRRPLSRRFLSWTLNLSHYHSFRDQSSVDLAKALRIRKPSPCLCDMAFAVPENEIETAREQARTGARPLVGIAPMAYMDSRYWPNADTRIAERYLDALAELSIWLMHEGYDLVLLKSQRIADERTASRLLEKVRTLESSLDEGRIANPETLGHRDLLQQMAGCEFVVGGRFHCHVLPFVLGIPVLGVSYHPKTEELMEQMGQEAYFVGMDDVTGGALIQMFQALRQNRSAAIGEIRRRSSRHRAMLERQFDEIFSSSFLNG